MSNSTAHSTKAENNVVRYLVILAVVIGAFFGAYKFALAKNASAQGVTPASSLAGTASGNAGSSSLQYSNATAQNAAGSASGSSASGGGCCGGGAPPASGITGSVAKGTATVVGGVQKINVDLSQGTYNPNTIVLKAGVPAEITFGQGNSCAAQIVSQDLGFSVDTYNGPKTVKLPALKAGEYRFSCSMQMIFGKIVVK